MSAPALAVPSEVADGKALWIEMRSPDGPIWSGMARSITVPGSDGGMGVLPRHAPLMSSLDVGLTRILDARSTPDFPVLLRGAKLAQGDAVDSRYQFVTGDGFVEIFQNRVLLLVDFAELTEEIDVERAQAAHDRARGRLRGELERTVKLDRTRVDASLRRALMRLQSAGKPKI